MRCMLIGGAGCIGSHFTDALLSDKNTEKVTIFDNFSSGRRWHYAHHIEDLYSNRLTVIACDIENHDRLIYEMKDHDLIVHLASNPDISKAVTHPDIDFWQGTALTNRVVEAMRVAKVNRLLYASGSGVYGDIGEIEAEENFSPLIPTSTYGASKLSGEAIIASYCHMFGLSACCFRFGNVVGARQTHGVGFDFTKRLLSNPTELRILGNGNQSKSYIHVRDIVNAVLTANEKSTFKFNTYNVATGDYITVNEIAKITADCLNIPFDSINIQYSGGDRGWKGDVPIVRLNTDKIKSIGWKCSMNTAEAVKNSILEMIPDFKLNKM